MFRARFHCFEQAHPLGRSSTRGLAKRLEMDMAWTRRKVLYWHDFQDDLPSAINYAEVQPAATDDEQTWDVGVFLNKERTELLQILQK